MAGTNGTHASGALLRALFGVFAALLIVPSAFGAGHHGAHGKKHPTGQSAAEKAVVSMSVDAVNGFAETPVLRMGASGAAVLQAQVLLDRAMFSPGEIDGRFRDNMRRAVAGFQRAHGAEPTGVIDADTWNELRSEGVPALIPYSLSDRDVEGPFSEIPLDIMQRARLHALPYHDAVEAVGEKFHVAPQLLRALNPGKPFNAGGEIIVPNVGDPLKPPRAGRLIVNKAERVLTVVDRNNGVLAQFPISIGGPLDVLPRGQWKVVSEVRDPVFYYDPAKIRTSKKGDTKTKIAPGPNNPVGVMWLGLSKPHYGLHGTPEPSKVGHEETSGCIHLTNWDIVRLAAMTSPGTIVEVPN